MAGRFARDDEVAAWQEDGWVAARRPRRHRGDRRRDRRPPVRVPGSGEVPLRPRGAPAAGPQHRRAAPRLPGDAADRSGVPARAAPVHALSSRSTAAARSSRLCVHPAIVDFMERALGNGRPPRVPDAGEREVRGRRELRATDAHRSQPLVSAAANGATVVARRVVPVPDRRRRGNRADASRPAQAMRSVARPNSIFMPDDDPELYAARARGRRCAAARCSSTGPTCSTAGSTSRGPGSHRFLLNVSYKVAGQDWIGYHSVQSNATHPSWVQFVEGSTPRELELFGFPPPGHPVWTAELVDATREKYPKLDVEPWRRALRR